ncbi:hypothetical protein DM790_25845 [Flavobacterium collinsii]|nr:hypothetical protein [Flavobacterium collinsii]
MDLDNVFSDFRSEVQQIIRDYWINIDSFKINCDRSITVDGSVKFAECMNYLTELPLKFDKINGNFDCSKLSLSTLKGSPKYVGGTFNCSFNDLNSLEYLPKKAKRFIFDNRTKSLFTGDINSDFEEVILLQLTDQRDEILPEQISQNANHLDVIFKYQNFFTIWNDSNTFDLEAFNSLITEIGDGLK